MLLLAGIWGQAQHTAEEKLAVAAVMVRRELFEWYGDNTQRREGESVSRLADLTVKMIGSMDSPTLKLKGMETYGFLCFLCFLLGKLNDFVGEAGQTVLQAGEALEEYVQLLKAHGAVLPPHAVQRATEIYNRHIRLMGSLDIEDWTKPKHHLMFHINHRSSFFGNPWFYTTFLDEGLNKNLKKMLRNCHHMRFETLALCRAPEMLARWRRKRAFDTR
jgi:hypothetical protein